MRYQRRKSMKKMNDIKKWTNLRNIIGVDVKCLNQVRQIYRMNPSADRSDRTVRWSRTLGVFLNSFDTTGISKRYLIRYKFEGKTLRKDKYWTHINNHTEKTTTATTDDYFRRNCLIWWNDCIKTVMKFASYKVHLLSIILLFPGTLI